VVLATSVLSLLRARFPGARVEWLVEAAYAPLLEGLTDGLITFRRSDPASRQRALEAVRGRFELAVDLQNKVWSWRVARAAAPRRVRLVKRTPWQALTALLGRDEVLDGLHATALYAAALAPLGVAGTGSPRLTLPPEARARAAALLPGEGWVGLVPGAAWATKRWPPARFGELALALASRGRRVALLGGPMDSESLQAVHRAAGAAVQADLSAEALAVVAAATERCEAVVGGDSGLMHVASALGTRAVVLFGPTSARRWAPLAGGAAVSLGLACSPCSNHGSARCPLGHHDCLERLPVERVLEAL
jgi:heptosyltransferase II